ncbi:MAG: SufD family Fe-S cluster assembly protein [Bacilli bacterium]
MSKFNQLKVSEKHLENGVLTLSNNDVYYQILDENDLPKTANSITLKSQKDIDFVIVLRSKAMLITYVIDKYTRGKIVFVCENEDVVINREIHLLEGVEIELIVPDFSAGNRMFNIETKLLGERAKANWHLSSYSQNTDKKVFKISFSHFGAKSYADMQNYGVVLDQSTLIFTGDSTIYEEVKGAETHQTARIIVFDEGSVAQADPILNIYHNDVIAASHAATVGRVNAEHLYYLNSRGLTELEAKQLITKGYLLPIINFIDDDGLKERFIAELEGVI